MPAAIQADGLDIGYRLGAASMTVLAGLDLTVETGGFLSILGPSGCGKSTFLRVVADLLDPIGGGISVLGSTPAESRGQRDVGFVFQDSTLLPWRTVRENVRLPLEVGRHRLTRTIEDRSGELLDLMGLSTLADRYPAQLSRGHRPRPQWCPQAAADGRALRCARRDHP
jgi:NitT/TauT family transport system ATP-binding protein